MSKSQAELDKYVVMHAAKTIRDIVDKFEVPKPLIEAVIEAYKAGAIFGVTESKKAALESNAETFARFMDKD